jgi:MFS transporter, DHA1 family, tetracycline resistance protein
MSQSGPRKGSLSVIFLTVFIDLLGFGMVLPLLPIYANQFTLDESGLQLGLLMAVFSAMQFIFAPIWGRVSDTVGRRPVLMVGLGSSVVFYYLFGLATVYKSFWLLFAARAGAGIAGATISTAQAYIADTTTIEQRPKGMALIGMAFGMGFTFGPLLGLLAVPDTQTDLSPWPGYFASMLSAVALGMAFFMLPESRNAESKPAEGAGLLQLRKIRLAVSVPSVGLILLAMFICVFSFANFETTLSLVIKGSEHAGEDAEMPFHFSWRQVCLTYAFIGFTLALVQGGIVRRVSGRVNEGTLAAGGAIAELIGFLLIVYAISSQSVVMLFVALGIVVTGFSFMQPSLNSLLSRRTDPEKQGVVMGLGQSVNSLARILGSGIGIPLLKMSLSFPYFVAASLMTVGGVLIVGASKSGRDYEPSSED